MNDSGGKPVQIERTAKRWKAMQLFGLVGLIADVACAYKWGDRDGSINTILLFGGIVFGIILAVGSFMAWWRHG